MSSALDEMHIDIGLVNSIVARSSLSFINGEEGILEYVGYDIDTLAKYFRGNDLFALEQKTS